MIPLTHGIDLVMKWSGPVMLIYLAVRVLTAMIPASRRYYEARATERFALAKTVLKFHVPFFIVSLVVGRIFVEPILTEKLETQADYATARIGGGVMLTVCASYWMFRLKRANLLAYAYIEGVFGVAICINTMRTLKNEIAPFDLLLILSSAYLMVRAFDNHRTAREKMQEVK